MSDNKVRIVLQLDGKQYSAELQTATRDTQAFTQSVASGARNATGHVDGLMGGITRLTQGMAGLAAGAVGVLSAREFIQTADAVTNLNNQLKLATGSTKAAAVASEELFAIAQRSRVSYTELGSTFAAVTRAGESLGLSQKRLLGVTEAIGNAMTVGGGAAASMQAALIQLSQGLASGQLRGEELNSVMEQTPRLARALADGLGVSIGQLRQMGQAGEITAEKVIAALESQAAVLRGEVAGATLTVSQSWTQLGNATTKAVGELDAATGASSALAGAVSGVASAVSELGKAAKDNETAIKVTLGVLGGGAAAAGAVSLASGLGKVRVAVMALGAVMSANPVVLTLLGIGAAVGGFVAYNNAASKTADGMRRTIQEYEQLNKDAVRSPYYTGADDTDTNRLIAERKVKIQELRQALAELDAQSLDTTAEDARLARYKQGAVATGAMAASLSDLRTRLSGFRGDYDKYQKDLVEIQRLQASGNLSEKEAIVLLTELAKKHGEAAKAAKVHKDTFVSGRDAAKEWADVLTGFDRIGAAATKQASGLDAADAAMKAYLESAQYVADVEAGRQNEVIQAYLRAKGHLAEAEALQRTATEYTALVHVEQGRIDALSASAASAEQRLQSLKDEELAVAMSASGHITLAQAIEEVAITRLRERQAALMREGDRDSEVLAIQREIDARKKLKDALGSKGVREAAEKGAKETADAYQRRTEQIEQGLTDALMRGGQSGKDYLVGLFRTTAFRIVLDPIMKPLSGLISGAVNTVMGGAAGTSALGTVGNAASLYNAGTSLMGMGGVASSASIISGATYGTGAATAQSIMLAGQEVGGTIGSAMIAGAESASGILSVAFDPVTLGVAALVAVLASMDDSGTPHMGGAAIADAAKGVRQLDTAALGLGIAAESVSTKIVDSSKQIANSALGVLQGLEALSGGKAKFSVATGFADDSSNDNSWGSLAITRDGKSVVDWRDTQTSRWAPKEFADGEAGAKEYGNAVAASIRQAIDQIDLPDWAKSIVAELGDAPSLEQLDAAMKRIGALPEQMLQAIGTSSQALSQTLLIGMQAGDPAGAGKAFADQVTYGIESSLYSGFASQVTGIVTTQLVTPVISAMASGATLTEAMASASVSAMKAQVAAAGSAFAAIVNDPGFQEALASINTLIKDTVGDAVAGQKAKPAPVAPVAYTLPVAATAVLAATTATSELAKAAEELAKKAASAVESLTSSGADLAVDLLRAQGEEKAALVRERENYLAQYKDLTQAEQDRIAQLYDSNQGIREQIALIERQKEVADERNGVEQQWLGAIAASAELRRRELSALDATNQALQQLVYRVTDLQAAADKADARIDMGYSTLQRSVDAEKTALADKLAADKEALATQEKASEDAVGNITTIFDALKSALKATTVETDALNRANRARAMATLEGALVQAKAGVRVDTLAGVEDALTTLAKPSEQLYSRFADYARAQDEAAQVMRELGDQTGGQLSVAELTLKATKGATTALEDAYQLQVKALDSTLEQWRTAIEVQRGTQEGVKLTIPQAIDRLATSLAEGKRATSAVQSVSSLDAYTPDQVVGAVDYVRNAAASGDVMGVYKGALTAGLNVDQLTAVINLAGYDLGTDDVRSWVSAQGLDVLPEAPKKFALGGAFTGGGVVHRPMQFGLGEMGEAGPEGILPLSNINGKLGVSAGGMHSSAAIVAAIEGLYAMLQAIAEASGATASHAYQAQRAAWELADRGVKVLPAKNQPIVMVAA